GTVSLTGNVTVTVRMPVLDCMFECGNRLWGCRFGRAADGSFVKYAGDSFEPKYFVKNLNVPTLWVAGTNDAAFEIAQWQKTVQDAPGTRAASLVVRLDHDHVGWDYEIVRRYADSFTGKDTALPAVSPLAVENGAAKAIIVSPGDGIRRAELIYSTENPGVNRKWETLPAAVEADTVSAQIPAGAKAVGIGVFDREYPGTWQFPVSTDVVELTR
ncbi:MAG: hypothetical protein MJ016_07360, partial [Victivallaceae bacterium]|nr:hypothetical protein [Victivallaceae bacterium]